MMTLLPPAALTAMIAPLRLVVVVVSLVSEMMNVAPRREVARSDAKQNAITVNLSDLIAVSFDRISLLKRQGIFFFGSLYSCLSANCQSGS
jgi:hypothetical protein